MKKLSIVVVALGIIGFMVSTSQAYTYHDVSVGDKVKMTGFLYQPPYAGGEMEMWNITDADPKNWNTWQTFCIQEGESIKKDKEYTVSGTSNPSSYLTAYLYYNFRTNPSALVGYLGTEQDQMDLQRLFWNLEDGGSYAYTTQMQAWYDAAVAANWTDYHGVQVLDLGDGVQDTLVINTPVPIPAAAWLLGSGLLGLVGLRRKMKA